MLYLTNKFNLKHALSVAVLLACVLQFTSAQAENYQDLIDEAAAALDDDFHLNWAYTETTTKEDVTQEARYDPRRPEGEKWQLLTVDGREPFEEEIELFLENKEERREDAESEMQQDEENDRNALNIVTPDTLELLSETDQHWEFSFVPHDEDEEKEFFEHITAKLLIQKNGRYVSEIEMFSEKPFKPQFAVKINRFLTRLRFGPAVPGGPVVPLSLEMDVSAKAFLFAKVNEQAFIEFSDYEQVIP